MKSQAKNNERQLRLMLENLIYFEKKQIELISLVCSVEFLLSSLESIDEEWEREVLQELTTLETVNALGIVKEAGEKSPEIEKNKKEKLINKSISNLKKIIENALIE